MEPFAQHFFEFARSVSPESRLRMAPTPSGFLHIGNAINFTLNWLAANYVPATLVAEMPSGASKTPGLPSGTKVAGTFAPKLYLRIDDLDTDRQRPEYVQDIFDSLQWLKLDWNEAPVFQSYEARKPLYAKVLQQLREQGMLFACRKSRRDLESFGGAYPSEFRAQNLSLDAPDVAWRIKTPTGFPLPDFVVRRRDGVPAYQVASFADDLDLGITHIVRGADLETSTLAQRFLAEVFSEKNFLKTKFLHHPLVLGEEGEKLSKSAGSASLKSMREAGLCPEKVFRTLGDWFGLTGDSAEELLASLRKRLA